MPDRKRQLAELREKLAESDRALVEQLDARAALSHELRALLEGEAPGVDVEEASWLAALVARSSGAFPEASLRHVLSAVRAESRAMAQPVRVAYLGPEGGLTHLTAQAQFGVGATYVESPTPADVLDEVVRTRATHAVFPYESSTDGLIQSSITALAATELVIVAERVAAVTSDLMSRTGNLADVEKIYATAAGHAACERFLERELPRADVLDVRSPRFAAELTHDDHGAAAIVPEATGRALGLVTIRQNIGDVPDLRCRYAIASARPAPRSGRDATCLLFSVDDAPGSLFEVLRHFAERGVNMKKLQSRPARGEGWDYVFYVEVSGHVTDRPVVTALEAVKRSTKYLRVLGSFQSMS
ncbi:MAG: ACT domain-containing protein [Sorangiineae bacterium]|nr:ACT domain-containing protein [Polyangiaceae bacterium]MEB2324623.1 ACT domain-containing protein [Sorangiineae bacterium]